MKSGEHVALGHPDYWDRLEEYAAHELTAYGEFNTLIYGTGFHDVRQLPPSARGGQSSEITYGPQVIAYDGVPRIVTLSERLHDRPRFALVQPQVEIKPVLHTDIDAMMDKPLQEETYMVTRIGRPTIRINKETGDIAVASVMQLLVSDIEALTEQQDRYRTILAGVRKAVLFSPRPRR